MTVSGELHLYWVKCIALRVSWFVLDSSVINDMYMVALCHVCSIGGARMCGESWLALKDSLTHHPSFQGWASWYPLMIWPCMYMTLYFCVLHVSFVCKVCYSG